MPHTTDRDFIKTLVGHPLVKDRQLKPYTMGVQLSLMLNGVSSGRGTNRIQPNKIIKAIADLTGLDHRYFMREKFGGISLPTDQVITYDPETQAYVLIKRNNPPSPSAVARLDS